MPFFFTVQNSLHQNLLKHNFAFMQKYLCKRYCIFLCSHMLQNLLQLSQGTRGPNFNFTFLASWVHLGVWFLHAYACNDFCFLLNTTTHQSNIINSCHFPPPPPFPGCTLGFGFCMHIWLSSQCINTLIQHNQFLPFIYSPHKFIFFN